MTSAQNMSPKQILRTLFDEGIKRVSADQCLARCLPEAQSEGKTLVLGAGKAAAAMASVVSNRYEGAVTGLVVTRYDHGVGHAIPGIEVIEAAHPVPDTMSQEAAWRALRLAGGLGAGDRLIFLASGGASSLLSIPAPGMTFTEKQALMTHLLRCGAPISEINCVRKHVSSIKGGRLAMAAGEAEVLTYVISDVPGDAPSDVGSGPSVVDHTTLNQALDIIDRYGAPDQGLVRTLLQDPANETPKAIGGHWQTTLVATADDCMTAASTAAEKMGLRVVYLGADLEGDSAMLGAEHGRLAKSLYEENCVDSRGENRPTLILSGGETTVTVKNPDGRGGRNMEYALSLAIELDGHDGIYALACDTDGIDGSEQAAGAIISPTTLERARALRQGAEEYLKTNRSFNFFDALDDLVTTGPTLTNVNDFRAILLQPKRGAAA